MDQDQLDLELELDLDLDLDLGDVGIPPVIEVEPGPERGPRALPIEGDPEVPWLTPVAALAVLGFAGLSLLILNSGGNGGQALAWALGGAFAVGYVGFIWLGTLYIKRHRYR
jgi:hypothetical protein